MASESDEISEAGLMATNQQLVAKIRKKLDRKQRALLISREDLERIDVQLTVFPILLAKARKRE